MLSTKIVYFGTEQKKIMRFFSSTKYQLVKYDAVTVANLKVCNSYNKSETNESKQC